MTDRADLTLVKGGVPSEPERLEDEPAPLEVGQWYWVAGKKKKDRWLGCVTRVGTNYVRLENPADGGNIRVHLDELDNYLTREPDVAGVLQERISHYQDEVVDLMRQVKEVTARLGVSPRTGIEHRGDDTRALVRVTGQEPDVKQYKGALVRAKDKELPALFDRIKEANKNLATWMQAEMLPFKAQAEAMKGCVRQIEDRIFNVSLYAGLTEDVVLVSDGAPAPYDDKLHLMQRRAYMDEECLLNYDAGGMEFKSLEAFDRWLTRPANLARLLPFPRCMVAMRVRRHAKARTSDGSALSAYINFRLQELDKLTFLYIRNGERLYRMGCDLEFDELIFPNRGEFDMTGPMMFCQGPSITVITLADFEERVRTYEEAKAAFDAWRAANPLKEWSAKWRQDNPDSHKRDMKWLWNQANPHADSWGEPNAKDPRGRWEPFNDTSVYYDEAMASVQQRVSYYNRLSLIIQGLYDRSEVLHPHPPVQTWTPEGFAAAVELVYDSDRALHYGDPPDFEEYAERLRGAISAGSVTIGQEQMWLDYVQDKEEARRSESAYSRDYRDVGSWWRPNGNDGPGYLARVVAIRAGQARFKWLRERRGKGWDRVAGDYIEDTYACPLESLFNVSAYTPGDHLRFFADPRSRADYLKWAPCLLAAEDYHAGKAKVQEPPAPCQAPKLSEIVDRLRTHLARMEADPKINRITKTRKGYRDGLLPFRVARVNKAGRFAHITYDCYFVPDTLTKGEAWVYLQWLDNGNNGKHTEMWKKE